MSAFLYEACCEMNLCQLVHRLCQFSSGNGLRLVPHLMVISADIERCIDPSQLCQRGGVQLQGCLAPLAKSCE